MVFRHYVMTSSLTVFMLINFAQPASAMYDPMLGRFASRDPIGEMEYTNLQEYVSARPTLLTDPEGTISINPVGYNLSPRLKECIGDAYIKWDFILSKTAGELCNGTHGWIVQKVTVSCSGEHCPKGRKCDQAANPESASYYEAWYVGPKQSKPTRHHIRGMNPQYTDRSLIENLPNSCGHVDSVGEVRFYCGFKPTTAAGPVSITVCNRTLTSGTLPGVINEPVWWTNRKSDDGVANRKHWRDWDCCPNCEKITDNSSAEPK